MSRESSRHDRSGRQVRAALDDFAPDLGVLSTGDLAVVMASLDVLVHPGEHETCCHPLREAVASLAADSHRHLLGRRAREAQQRRRGMTSVRDRANVTLPAARVPQFGR